MPYTFGQTWFYFLFFLPGLVTFFFGHHFLEPLWSIGVEEVFYLIWAPLFKLFKKDNILPLLLSVLVVKVVLMILAQYFIKNELFGYVVNMLSFEAMAIGGLGAYWVFHRTAPVSEVFIYKLPAQVVIYLLLGVHIVFYNNIDNVFWNALFKTPIVSQLFVDLLFLYLMIGTSLVDNNIIKLRSKALSYLGEISYGIYMYHMLVIFAIIQFLKRYLVGLSPLVSTLGFYAILTLLVIVVAGVSKATFENYFLGLKKKLHKNQKA
jgi:peptidoglycan/LPS O-acetylase OafA/YrhL